MGCRGEDEVRLSSEGVSRMGKYVCLLALGKGGEGEDRRVKVDMVEDQGLLVEGKKVDVCF